MTQFKIAASEWKRLVGNATSVMTVSAKVGAYDFLPRLKVSHPAPFYAEDFINLVTQELYVTLAHKLFLQYRYDWDLAEDKGVRFGTWIIDMLGRYQLEAEHFVDVHLKFADEEHIRQEA